MSCLKELVGILSQIRYESMPEQTVEQAKNCIADCLSIFAFGKNMQPALELKAALGGDAVYTNAEDLAYWIGGATRLLDLDDGQRFAMGHPGVPIVSAAVATARMVPQNICGTLFLESIVRAYETYCYIGRCINPSSYLERGFDATCVCGASAAAVASGTLLGLSDIQLANAIAIAASLCGGLNQYVEDGSSPKYLCAGWGAKLGISAAKLASHGLTGPDEVFEGRLGFCHAFSPEPNLEHMMHPKLSWEINYSYLKRFSCVWRIHTTLDCVKDIFREDGLSVDDVATVNVYGGRFIASAGSYAPTTEVKAQTCVPYTVALLMRYDEVTLERIENHLHDPEIETLSRKVIVVEDETFNRLTERDPSLWGAVRVELIDKQGNSHIRESHVAIGDPEKPFSKEILHKKFMSLALASWDEARAQAIWESIQSLEKKQSEPLLFLNIIN